MTPFGIWGEKKNYRYRDNIIEKYLFFTKKKGEYTSIDCDIFGARFYYIQYANKKKEAKYMKVIDADRPTLKQNLISLVRFSTVW